MASFGFVDWSAGGLMGSSLIIGDRHVEIASYAATEGFGQTLGVPMALGRWFTAADHRQTSPTPVWISDKFWESAFGRDPRVLGRAFRTTNTRITDVQIVGVMAPAVSSFDLNNEPPDVVVPGHAEPPNARLAAFTLSSALVRLPEAMTKAEGEARLNAIYHAMPPPGGPRPWKRGSIELRSLREMQVSGGRPTARVLLTGAVLILLLVGANLVHLLLARGESRAAEVSVRSALGASRWRTVRLFLVESLLLGVAGIAGGLMTGWWLAEVIRARVPTYPTSGRNLSLVPMMFDHRVVWFAIVVGLVLVGYGGWWPARRAIRQPLILALRGTSAVPAALRTRVARVILASELMIATVVLAGAVFLGMGIWRYLNQPLGFDYHDRFYVSVETPAGAAGAGKGPSGFADLGSVGAAMASIPGVVSATPTVRFGSYIRTSSTGTVAVGDQILPWASAVAYTVGPGAFRTWAVAARQGRVLSDEEIANGAPVAVVDERLAHLAWPGGNPLGKTLRVGESSDLTVVGVIAPIVRRLDTMDTAAEVYVPAPANQPASVLALWVPGGSAESVRPRVATIVANLAPGGYLRVEPVTFATEFRRESGEALFQGPIITAFGLLAFIVAGVGLFGLVSYLVERRLREFGIRIALGARPAHLWSFVMRESLGPSMAGLVLGLFVARMLDLYVRSKVFGWEASGVLASAIVGVLLVGVALGASFAPARRAMRVDPIQTLRAE